MPFHNVDTFYSTLCFRDIFDGDSQEPIAESVYICIDEERTLRIFDGKELNHWIFTVDPIPQEPLFTVDLKSSACFVDFRRVMSSQGNHLLGRMRITNDFGGGLERLTFKFPIEEYNRIGSLVMSFRQSNRTPSVDRK